MRHLAIEPGTALRSIAICANWIKATRIRSTGLRSTSLHNFACTAKRVDGAGELNNHAFFIIFPLKGDRGPQGAVQLMYLGVVVL